MTQQPVVVPVGDGTEVYTFDYTGRHVTSRDPLTGAAIYEFSYNAGLLTEVTSWHKHHRRLTGKWNSWASLQSSPLGAGHQAHARR
jgi:hypothetical protein